MGDADDRGKDEGMGADGIPTAGYGGGVVGPGAAIGRYKLLRILEEGGYGIVYLAEQQRPMKRCVVLKLINAGDDPSSEVKIEPLFVSMVRGFKSGLLAERGHQ